MPRRYFSAPTRADLPSARRRRGSIAFTCAIAFHLVVLFLTASYLTLRFAPKPQPTPEIVALTTIRRTEHRTVPQPAAPQPPSQRRQRPPQLQNRPARAAATVARRAVGTPPPESSTQRFVRAEQVQLAAAAARINARRAPLALATIAPHPQAFRRSIVDSGQISNVNDAEAYLLPLHHWFTGEMSCYYVRYYASFSQGGNERGEIPWPVCYPRNHDELAHGPYPHSLPVPYPQRSYVLPTGTYLTPFMAEIYDRRPS